MGARELKAIIALVVMMAMVVVMTLGGGVWDKGIYAEADKKPSKKARSISPSTSTADKEMVYVLQKPDGKEYERIVSAENQLHYEGYEDAVLPVDMKITYLLDDEPVKAEDLVGEKGHLKIIVEYKNKLNAGNVKVPLLAVTGAVFSNEKFSDVEVTPGRVMDDGSRTIAMGFCLPGMSGDLGLSSEESGLYDMMMIECDTEDYEMEEFYTLVTADPFKEMDLGQVSSMSELGAKLGEMGSSATELTEGTGKLASGSIKLAKAAKKIAKAGKQVDKGAEAVSEGNRQISDKMPDLVKGAADLSKGSKSVYEGNTKLVESLRKMYGEAPTKDSKGSGTLALKAGTNALAQGTGEMDKKVKDAEKKVKDYTESHDITLDEVKALAADADKQVTELLALNAEESRTKLDQGAQQAWQVLESPEATEEQKAKAKAQIEAIYKQMGQLEMAEENQKKLVKLADAIGTMKKKYGDLDSDNIDKAIKELKKAQKDISDMATGADQIDQAVAELNVALAGKDGKGKGEDNLIGAASALSKGSGQVYDGVVSLHGGSKKLAEGMEKAAEGSEQLSDGTSAISKGQMQMAKGASTLAMGAETLDSAIGQAMEQVQTRLQSLDVDKITGVIDNLDSVQQAALGYKGFGGKKTYDSVTFIYKVDEIKK